MATSPNFGGVLQPITARIQNSDSTNKVSLATAGSTPRVLTALSASSTDTVSRDVSFFVTNGGVDYLICTITVPASSGNAAATPPVNLLAHVNWTWFEYDAMGNKVCVLPASAILKAASGVQVTTAKEIDFLGDAQDFS